MCICGNACVCMCVCKYLSKYPCFPECYLGDLGVTPLYLILTWGLRLSRSFNLVRSHGRTTANPRVCFWVLSPTEGRGLARLVLEMLLSFFSLRSGGSSQLIGPIYLYYRWTWMWRTQWDQENWSVICKIRRAHMTNTWYASDWDQAYRPSYAKIRHTVVRHIQVHLHISDN